MSSRSNFRQIVSAWLPAMIGVLVIVMESTDYFSSANTNGPLRHLWTTLFGPPISNMAWERTHALIRKSGHVLGYGILNALFFRAWYITLRIINEKTPQPWLVSTFLALLSTFVIGSFDELHQKLLPSRTGSPFDVAVDMAGAIAVQVIISIFYVNRARSRQQLPVETRS